MAERQPPVKDSLQTILWVTAGLVAVLFMSTQLSGAFQQITATHVEKGKMTDVTITLITADSQDLACSMDGQVAGAHCAYDGKGKPLDTAGPQLAPYMTADSANLFLIPDLWSEPALKARLTSDPPRDREHSKRFTASCRFTPQDTAKGFLVRWSPTGEWAFHDGGWVGTISKCKISG